MSVVASLAVKLTADVAQFGEGMSKAAKQVEDTAGKLKGIGEEVGKVGLLMSAGIGGALALMAERSEPAKALMDGFKDASATLAQEIVTAVTPALEQLMEVMKMGLGVLQKMDPETKTLVGTIAALTAGAGMAVATLGQMSGVISGVMKGFTLLSGILTGPVLLGIGAVVAGVAGAILIAGALKTAWDENLGGVQEIVAGVKEAVLSAFSAVVGGIERALSFVRSSIIEAVKMVKETIDKVNAMVPERFRGVGQAASDALKGAIAFLEEPSILAQVAKDALTAIKDFAADTGRDIGNTWKKGLEATGLQAVIDRLTGMMAEVKEAGASVKMVDFDKKLDSKKPAEEQKKEEQKKEEEKKKPQGRRGTRFSEGGVQASVAMSDKPERAAFDDLGMLGDYSKASAEELELLTKGTMAASLEMLTFEYRVKQVGKQLVDGLLAGSPIEEMMNAATSGAESMIKAIGEGGGAAGPIGALVGIVIELLKKADSFIELMDMVSEMLGAVANGLGAIIDPVVTLVAALWPAINAIVAILAPIGIIVDAALKPLIPLLVMLGLMLEPLAPIIEVLAQLVSGIVNVIYLVLNPFLDALANTFRMLGIGFVFLAKGLGSAWNWILDAVTGFLNMLGLTDLAAGAAAMKVDLSGLDAMFVKLTTATDESAIATAEAARAKDDETEATKKATDAMLNVPSGFKTALARFNAIATDAGNQLGGAQMFEGFGAYNGLRPMATGGVVTGPTPALVGEAGPEAVIPLDRLGNLGGGGMTVHIHGINDPEKLWARIRRLMERDNFRSGRGLYGLGPAVTG